MSGNVSLINGHIDDCEDFNDFDDFDDDDEDYPCVKCGEECDSWNARYCCTLCHYYSDEPDCDGCDSMDT